MTTPAVTPDYHTVWLPPLPDFTIRVLRSTQPYRCVSETHYEIVSRHEIDADDFKRLDACGLLGIGQSYSVSPVLPIIEVAKPTAIARNTGLALPDVVPVGYNGEPIIKEVPYTYYRYEVRRICDSGD